MTSAWKRRLGADCPIPLFDFPYLVAERAFNARVFPDRERVILERRMRVVARSTLVRFVQTLAGVKEAAAVKAALEAWFHEVDRAKWRTPADVKSSYASASIIGEDRVVLTLREIVTAS